MYQYEAVIFDLDGTLLNTLEDLKDSVNMALKTYGYPQKDLEQIRTYVGNGIRKLIERSVEGGEKCPDFEKIFQKFQEDYKLNCRNKTKPYDGILEILRKLQRDGRKIAIVSNKADFAVKELNEYYFKEFHLVAVGEKEGIQKKPAADMVFQALEELGVSAENAIYVGDSDVDIQTAKNAKIPCISVLWGFRDKEFLQEHQAEYFAEKPQDILAYL